MEAPPQQPSRGADHTGAGTRDLIVPGQGKGGARRIDSESQCRFMEDQGMRNPFNTPRETIGEGTGSVVLKEEKLVFLPKFVQVSRHFCFRFLEEGLAPVYLGCG